MAKCADPLVPINGCPTPQTCIKECPQEAFIHDKTKCSKDLAEYKKKMICKRRIDVQSLGSCEEIDEKVKNQECAQWYLKSEPCKYFHYNFIIFLIFLCHSVISITSLIIYF